MVSDKTTEIADEAIRLLDLQAEALKGTLAEMTVSQVHEYAETPITDRIIEASIQWAERIMQRIDSLHSK